MFGYALIAKERQVSALWLNLSALAFNIGLNFLLVPRYGIVAAAIVTVASELLILAGSYPLMKRYFGFFPAPRTLLAAVVAAAGDGRLGVAAAAGAAARARPPGSNLLRGGAVGDQSGQQDRPDRGAPVSRRPPVPSRA